MELGESGAKETNFPTIIVGFQWNSSVSARIYRPKRAGINLENSLLFISIPLDSNGSWSIIPEFQFSSKTLLYFMCEWLYVWLSWKEWNATKKVDLVEQNMQL